MSEMSDLTEEFPEREKVDLRRVSRREDISGRKFGKLTAVSFVGYEKNSKRSRWLFVCECGNRIVKRASHVKSGAIQSCGCIGHGWGNKAPDQGMPAKKMMNAKRWRAAFDKLIERATQEELRYAREILVACDCAGNLLPQHTMERLD